MTVNNFIRMAIIGLICYLYIFLSSCSPKYTEAQARQLYGCKTDSTHIDSVVHHHTDTFYKYVEIPGDSVVVNGPCEEIKNMKPGDKKYKKSETGRSTAEWGKDITGASFFNCYAQEYKDSMEWYRDVWHTTVYKTNFQSNSIKPPTVWQIAFDYGRNVFCIIGLIAIALLVIKFRSQ